MRKNLLIGLVIAFAVVLVSACASPTSEMGTVDEKVFYRVVIRDCGFDGAKEEVTLLTKIQPDVYHPVANATRISLSEYWREITKIGLSELTMSEIIYKKYAGGQTLNTVRAGCSVTSVPEVRTIKVVR